MKEMVAKKYVKALMSVLDSSEFDVANAEFAIFSSAYNIPKFRAILNSPDITMENKVNFLFSLMESNLDKLKKFIQIVAHHKRLNILPEIAKEFARQKSLKDNVFVGQIFGKFEFNDEQKAKLEESFSRKFGSKISFERVKDNYNGIKIELDSLGLEVSFSVDKLKTQMSEYILKAI